MPENRYLHHGLLGVGFEMTRLDSLYPQLHDVPMDIIVTEQDMLRRP